MTDNEFFIQALNNYFEGYPSDIFPMLTKHGFISEPIEGSSYRQVLKEFNYNKTKYYPGLFVKIISTNKSLGKL